MNKSFNEPDDVNQMVVDELNLAVQGIDGKTSDALKAARKQALAKHVSAKPLFSFINPRMTTAFASVGGVVMIAVLLNQSTTSTTGEIDVTEFTVPEIAVTDSSVTDNAEALESLPILFAPDGLEFFQSVDFLVWMEKNTG